MPQVNPEILRWARETAGLTPEEAARSLGIREARGVAPVERLSALENGETEPSRPTLVKMAKVYRRPLVVFYLSHPPVRGDRGEDFRTLPIDHAVTDDALLDAMLRDVRARQSMVRAILVEEERPPHQFVGSKNIENGVYDLVASIRETLNFDLQVFRTEQSASAAFAYLRRCAEDIGIFVMLIGNLGSHHSAIDVEIFRGFAIADSVAPFVVINDQDARRAWAFTLLHELAHIWLGQTGISGISAERRVEQFCNDVAGEILVEAGELGELIPLIGGAISDAATAIQEFSDRRNISRSMVAYKLLRHGEITHNRWVRLAEHFRGQWLEERNAMRVRARAAESGPNYYVVRRHRVGAALIDLIRRTLADGEITTSKAGKVLGVKPKNVEPLISRQLANSAQRA